MIPCQDVLGVPELLGGGGEAESVLGSGGGGGGGRGEQPLGPRPRRGAVWMAVPQVPVQGLWLFSAPAWLPRRVSHPHARRPNTPVTQFTARGGGGGGRVYRFLLLQAPMSKCCLGHPLRLGARSLGPRRRACRCGITEGRE